MLFYVWYLWHWTQCVKINVFVLWPITATVYKTMEHNCSIAFQNAQMRVTNSIDTVEYLSWTIQKLSCLNYSPVQLNWEYIKTPKFSNTQNIELMSYKWI